MTFDEKAAALHRVARLTFVPWMARFLGEGNARVDSAAPLPVGDPGALTDETVEAIQVIANRSCWKFLAQECGWKKLRAVDPGNADAHGVRRLWEKSGALPRLVFSTAAPDLLLAVFNASRQGESIENLALPDCLQHNGDLILQHLVFRRISASPKAFGLEYDHRWPQWYANPLNALLNPEGPDESSRRKIRWDRLFASDIAPFMPWIGSRLADGWKGQCQAFWGSDPEQRLSWLSGLTHLLTGWGLAAERCGRIDLLNAHLDFLSHHQKSVAILEREFHRLTDGCTLREWQRLASIWADFLDLITPLEEVAARALGCHPVERTGAQNCFLAAREAANFGGSVQELRELSRRLRPVFQ